MNPTVAYKTIFSAALTVEVLSLGFPLKALSAVSCSKPGDIQCWRDAAIEKIIACDDPSAELLRQHIEVLKKIPIKAEKSMLVNGGHLAFTDGETIHLSKTLTNGKMTDRHVPPASDKPADGVEPVGSSPFDLVTALGALVHEMAHVSGHQELLAQHLQQVCVDTFTKEVACGYVPVCDDRQPLWDQAVMGSCDAASAQSVQEDVTKNLAAKAGDRSHCDFKYVYDASLLLDPPEEQLNRARAFIAGLKDALPEDTSILAILSDLNDSETNGLRYAITPGLSQVLQSFGRGELPKVFQNLILTASKNPDDYQGEWKAIGYSWKGADLNYHKVVYGEPDMSDRDPDDTTPPWALPELLNIRVKTTSSGQHHFEVRAHSLVCTTKKHKYSCGFPPGSTSSVISSVPLIDSPWKAGVGGVASFYRGIISSEDCHYAQPWPSESKEFRDNFQLRSCKDSSPQKLTTFACAKFRNEGVGYLLCQSNIDARNPCQDGECTDDQIATILERDTLYQVENKGWYYLLFSDGLKYSAESKISFDTPE